LIYRPVPQSFNRYSYVQNDPVNFGDPTGLDPDVIRTYTRAPRYFDPLFLSGGRGGGLSRPTPYVVEPRDHGLGDQGHTGPQNPVAPLQHTPDACGDMADNAQNIATEALFNNGISGLGPHSSAALGNAVGAFDTAFTTLYAGRAATSIVAAGRQWVNRGAGATVDHYYLGETGFRPEFMDTGQNGAGQLVDQTHHFAFYLSVGINANAIGPLRAAQWMHRQRDNQGDANLGRAAFEMGRNLRNSPTGLQSIGSFIRSAICDQNRNPAH